MTGHCARAPAVLRDLAMRSSLGPAALLATLAWQRTAAADTSGWAYVSGAGLAWSDADNDKFRFNGSMTIDMGVGTSDQRSFIGGGLFRIQPVFAHGVDLSLLARFCNQGFQTSWVGFALDAGVYQRTWGLKSRGFLGEAVLGGPLGLELAVMGSVGTDSAKGFGANLGVDFARLLVHRSHFDKWWPNPHPERSLGGLAMLFGG